MTLEAVAGPVAGRRIEVPEGSILRIGRTAKADHVLGEDSYLSGLHFSIEWDGRECRVRDLGSSNGTFVNGDRITEAVLEEGNSLAAGGTTFLVHLDSIPQPQVTSTRMTATARTMKFPDAPTAAGPIAGPLAGPVAPKFLERSGTWPGFSRPQTLLLDELFSDRRQVYALLDPVRDSRIPTFLDASGEPFALIDAGVPAAPFLARISPDSKLLDVLIKDGWRHGWGFYATSDASFDESQRHWQGLVILKTAKGQDLTFRFWDPRVLRAMLPLMAPEEAAAFFGPHSRILVEGERPDSAIEFSLSRRGVRQRVLVIT